MFRRRLGGARSASCDLASQGSSLRSSGNPTPAARANPCATEIATREGRNLLRPYWTPRIGGGPMAGQALGRFAL